MAKRKTKARVKFKNSHFEPAQSAGSVGVYIGGANVEATKIVVAAAKDIIASCKGRDDVAVEALRLLASATRSPTKVNISGSYLKGPGN